MTGYLILDKLMDITMCGTGLTKMNVIYFILILNTFTQTTYSQKTLRDEASKISLHLCCPINEPDQKFINHVDCDKPGAGTEQRKYFLQIPGNLTTPKQASPFLYSLKYRETTCSGDIERKVVSKQMEASPTQNITFLKLNSYLQIDQEYYHHNEFCLYKVNEEFIELQVCEGNCPSQNVTGGQKLKSKSRDEQRSTTCIRKCCPSGQSFTFKDKRRAACTSTDVHFSPTIYASHNHPLSKSQRQMIDFHVSHAKAREFCPQGTRMQLLPYGYEQAIKQDFTNLCFQTHQNGKVYYRDQARKWFQAENYCIEAVKEYRTTEWGDTTDETEFIMITCSLPEPSPETLRQNKERQELYGGVMISSSIFLLLTFIVYSLLWDQKGLHGWTTLGHSSSMFLAYIFLGTAHILSVQKYSGEGIMEKFPCIMVGVLAHFFFLSSFCWLALISFDLWWTFRALNPKVSRSRGARRFLFYVFCGWVTPSIAVVISLVLDSQYTKENCGHVFTPQYGQFSCYLNRAALGEYIYYPVAGLLLLNLLFFLMTIWKLYEYKKTTRIATSNLESKRQFFKLFTKLFFVCGITWAFEVISWVHVGTDTPWYWILIDIINVFQAIEVFVIYVCKKDTVFALQRKYPPLKPILEPFVKLFKCKRSSQDAEQSSRLNSSNSQRLTRDKTITRDSALTTSIRTSSTVETDVQ